MNKIVCIYSVCDEPQMITIQIHINFLGHLGAMLQICLLVLQELFTGCDWKSMATLINALDKWLK